MRNSSVGGRGRGYRAVRWDASGTAATELGNLGTDPTGYTSSEAVAINTAGTTVGQARSTMRPASLPGLPRRPLGASGTAATELGNLGTAADGSTFAVAEAVNAAGTAVGFGRKFNAGARIWAIAPSAGMLRHGRDRAGEPGHRLQRQHGQRAYAINDAGMSSVRRRSTPAARITGGVRSTGGTTALRSTSTR